MDNPAQLRQPLLMLHQPQSYLHQATVLQEHLLQCQLLLVALNPHPPLLFPLWLSQSDPLLEITAQCPLLETTAQYPLLETTAQHLQANLETTVQQHQPQMWSHLLWHQPQKVVLLVWPFRKFWLVFPLLVMLEWLCQELTINTVKKNTFVIAAYAQSITYMYLVLFAVPS